MARRTLREWNARDRRIKRGSKAVGFTSEGEALFKKSQTYEYYEYVEYDWDTVEADIIFGEDGWT